MTDNELTGNDIFLISLVVRSLWTSTFHDRAEKVFSMALTSSSVPSKFMFASQEALDG